MKWLDLGLEAFLYSQPGMVIKPCQNNGLVLAGAYRLYAAMLGNEVIDEIYELKVIFPNDYPKAIPAAFETGDKIKKTDDFHINPGSQSLCLGSALKVLSISRQYPEISSFFDLIIDPFLYSIRFKEKHGFPPYGELEHGEDGLVQDYQDLFGVEGKKAVLDVLEILSKRKRVANKSKCPCQCGQRLGMCDYRFKLDKWRYLAKRRWFKGHLTQDFKPLPKPKSKRKMKRKSRKKL